MRAAAARWTTGTATRRTTPLAQAVGATAFRMSLEWARIEPERGRFDGAALEGYRERLLQHEARAGLRPVVTLHHFTHPHVVPRADALAPAGERGGLPRATRAGARALLEGLDALVITFNEPMVLLLGGYLAGR